MYLNMDYEMHMGTKLEFSRVRDYSKFLQYSSCILQYKINVSKNEHISLLFWCYLLKTRASPDICFREIGQCFSKLWPPILVVWLPTSSFATSYNEPVLWPNPNTLRRTDSIRWPHYTANISSGQLTKMYWSDQKCLPNWHGLRKLMIYANTWYCTPGQTRCVWSQRSFTKRCSFFSRTSWCWNVHRKRP